MSVDGKLSVALVLETHNLRAGARADGAAAVAALSCLLARLRGGTLPLDRLAEVIITHDGIAGDAQARLEAAAGTKIEWVEVDAGTDYYAAKNRGFAASTAEVVAFADADCWPELEWLERLVAPFVAGGVEVVAGRTTYRRDLLGVAASTIDFMYWPSPLGDGCTRNFYANNVAFRRQTFAELPYAPADMYRGHCQILGMRLHAAGVKVHFVPEARTIHRFPDRAGQLVRLRLLRGSDTVEIAPHLAAAYVPRRWRRMVSPLSVLAARFAFSVRAINHQDMPRVSGARRAAVVGAIAALSAVDAVGAAVAMARPRRHAAVTLSYHRDRDRLRSRPTP